MLEQAIHVKNEAEWPMKVPGQPRVEMVGSMSVVEIESFESAPPMSSGRSGAFNQP